MTPTARPLRVLYSFPGRLGVPGIGTTAWQQARGLTARGDSVTVACGSLERPLPGARTVVQTMRIAGARVPYRLLGDDRSFAWHDWRVARLLRAAPGRFDVVHCWPLGALRTLAAAHSSGVVSFLERPNTHTEHAYSVVAEECRRIGLSLPPGHSHRPNERRLTREAAEYAAADRLACPSEAVVRTFLSRGFAESRLVRHRYGFDPDVYRPESVAANTEIESRPIRAVFLGSCEPRKGLHHALAAWLQSDASRAGIFQIVGRFVEGYRTLLEPMLAHPSVQVTGPTTNAADVLRSADLLLLPSLEEGSALVTYEARACGCVLLVSDAAGAVCVDGHDALVHPAGHVNQLVEHLNLLCRDRPQLSRLRRNSLSSVSSLTWDRAAERLHGLYIESCDSRVARAPVSQRGVAQHATKSDSTSHAAPMAATAR